ncbi:MAG: glycosyl hydrolase [Planctomycetota bacterium]
MLHAVLLSALLVPQEPVLSGPKDADALLAQPASSLVAGETVALAYSGFRAGQHPDRGDGAKNPSRAEILEDLQILEASGVRLVRLYDAGENSSQVLDVIDEEGLAIRVLLGCWLRAELSNHEACAWLNEPIPDDELAENRLWNVAEVGRTVALAHAHPASVSAVNVGNEALVDWNDHRVEYDSVLAYVRTVRAAIEQPVTVADNWAVWTTDAGARLAAELDFVGVHSYPVWEGAPVEDGLVRTIRDVARVRAALPDAPLAILEAGWATTANEFGPRASEAHQARYVAELCAWGARTNVTVFLFEAFDEPWKGDPNNPAGAEKHWGLWNVDRTPKAAARALTKAIDETAAPTPR